MIQSVIVLADIASDFSACFERLVGAESRVLADRC